MKKSFLLLFCMLLLATNAMSAAELNVYASGLKTTGMTEDRKLSISYFLNTDANIVIFQLLDVSNLGEPIYEVTLDGKAKGENSAVIDLLDKIDPSLNGIYTWAIKAKSNTTNTQIALAGGGSSSNDLRFNFHTPAGLAIDNNPNSPYFGRIYVTESREGQKTPSNRDVQQGVYIYGADLSDITGQDLKPYAGGVCWNTSTESLGEGHAHDTKDMFGPARITVDDDGYVYICDNGPVADNTSGVWRMDPANPSANFVDVLHSSENRGTLYQRINSATVVQENGKKYLYAVDNQCLNSSVANLLKVPIETTAAVQREEKVTNILTGIVNAHNTIVKGAYNDLWVFQFRNGVEHTGILHINKEGNIDLNQRLLYNRRGSGAISPDGNWLAYCGYEKASIRIVPVTYNNGQPTIGLGDQKEMDISSLERAGEKDNFVDGIAFDVAGNLYFASATDHWFHAYALPKVENSHTTIAPNSQQITFEPISPQIRMMAYNLRLKLTDEYCHFSFYANSQPIAGKLLFYKNKELTGTPAYEYILSNLKQGDNNVAISHQELADLTLYTSNQDVYWAVELTGKKNHLFGKVHENNTILNHAHAAIDNSPESDFFGRVYVENRVEKTNKNTLYVFDYDHSTLVYEGLCGMNDFAAAARPAVDDKGYVYWADWGDNSHGGVYVTDPHNLNESTAFFQGNVATNGLWENNNVGIGSSSCGVYFYGAGANAKLFVMNEDAYNNDGTTTQDLHNNGYCVYNIGQQDGSILRTWGQAPSLGVKVSDNLGTNFSIVGTSHGAFLCQNRTKDHNESGAYSLQFYDNNGTRQWTSDGKTNTINGSLGGGAAVTPDESQLFIVNGDGNIVVFDIEWNGDAPGLTHYRTYETEFGAISTMHFDYAGNLVVMAGTQYGDYPIKDKESDMRLVVYTLPTENNTILVPAPESQKIPRTLVLKDTEDNKTILDDAKTQTLNALVYRSLTAGMYNTLCLPFDAPLTEGPLADAKAYTFSTSSETTGGDILLHFTEENSIVAGKPYLIEPQEDISGPIHFTNITIAASEGGSTGDDIKFNGILAPQQLTEGDKSILFLVSNNRLAWANTTANMNGMRAYFSLPEGAYDQLRTRARIVTSESTTTDIQQTTTTSTNAQKLILNGMLYILKDGQLYTVFGTKVK